MAIISIPNSIGGVSIPGALISGPLGALFGNKFGRTDLQYPRDLQSSTRGHVVMLDILEVQPATYESLENKVLGAVKSFPGSIESAKSSFVETINSVKNGAENIAETGSLAGVVDSVKEVLGSNSIYIKNPVSKSVATVSLYMPDTMSFQYSMKYGELSLVDAAKQIPVLGAAVGAVSSIINSGPARLLAKGSGYAFNPQQQMLFDGIDFRDYTMSFTFTPYSKDEAQTVAKIVKMFKMHAVPRLAQGSAGMFFIPPSLFELKFMFNEKENPHVGKVAKSVITGIDVNYSPNGFSTFGDGAPVQTTLTLSFRETELITRDKIENEGY